MAEDRWKPDPADVERRKNKLLSEARGEDRREGPNPLVGLGLQFVVTVLICLFLGQWLDRKLGTSPWLMLAGMLVGSSIGIWTMFRVARQQDPDGGASNDSAGRGDRGGGK